MEDSNVIGLKIRNYRKAQNMSQIELSELSGINISTIKKYESGYRKPKMEQLSKITDALNISINEFMDYELMTVGDIVSIIMKLDDQSDLTLSEKNGVVSISFTDSKINSALAEYVEYKKLLESNTDQDLLKSFKERLLLYKEQIEKPAK